MRFLASIAAGAIVAWSFYLNHWWASIFGMAILLLTLDSKPRKTRFKLTLAFALTFFAFHVQWVSVLGNDAWLGLVILCTLPWLLFALLPIDSKSKWFYVQPAAVVVILEAIRANWPWGGFPWGLLAYSQVDGPLVGLSTLGGQALVSGAVVVCATVIIKFLKFRSITALTILFFISLSAASVNNFTSNESIELAAVQGNVPRVGNDLSTQRAAVLNSHVKTTEQLLTDIEAGVTSEPDLIVWPESGTDLDPLEPGIAADAINKLAIRSQAPILIGATTWYSSGSKGERPTNSGIMWTEDGLSQIYSKNHLVPFGEYLPLRDFLAKWITRFDQIPNDFVPGEGSGVFDVAGMQVGDVICFEVAYANHIYNTINSGAQVITVQTNNATYGKTTQPEQQFAITRFRAIETQRAFLVASTSGISGLIQNDGSVTGRTNQFESAIVTGEAPLISEKTFSTKFPYWFLVLSAIVLLLAVRRSSGSKIK
ncbi:MAG: apolipoprotein N-acyltransferase [Candidatus Nanopelagicales bacterium]